MQDFEEKLNHILSSPEEMEKIMGLARSISGSIGQNGTEHQNTIPSPPQKETADTTPFSGLNSLDPKLMQTVTRIWQAYAQNKNNEKMALLYALKPYLKKSRHRQIEKAIEIARLTAIAKLALAEFSGGDSIV